MRKTILLTLLLIQSFSVYSDNDSESKDNTQVEYIMLQNGTVNRPRTGGVATMVECYYYGGMLYVHFFTNVEVVNISVTDISTGEQYDQFYSDDNRSFTLPVSNNAGEYYVNIEFDSSSLYGYYIID